MKSTHLSVFVGLVTLALLARDAAATPVGHPNSGRNYMIGMQPLHRWCAGVFVDGSERDVKVGGIGYEMTRNRAIGYLGFDIISWITAYVGAGASEVEMSFKASPVNSKANDADVEYGGGIGVNILDHEVLDPTLFEDRLRINGGVSYWRGQSDWEARKRTLEWGELQASLILSIVNDCEGEKKFRPNSVGIFVGPVYCDYIGGDIKTNDKVGFTGGLEVFYSETISLNLGIQSFGGNTGYAGGIHARF